MKALLVVMVVCELTKKLSNGSPVDYWSENFDAGNYKHFLFSSQWSGRQHHN